MANEYPFLVTITEAIQLLEKFRAGGVGRDRVLRAFQAAPVANLGFAQVDDARVADVMTASEPRRLRPVRGGRAGRSAIFVSA